MATKNSLLRQAREYYKELKAEDKNKKKLLSSKSDFNMLEQLIQKVNDNPNLRIEVFLNDGTRLILKNYVKKETSQLINGDYEEIR
ncbi:MAG: hypothetical protein MJ174_07475 [Treponema sp.]|nr:hypothetical protein [Treponema sp.]